MNFLSKIAPFLSTALGLAGPWGALAGKALSTALGTKSAKPEDLVTAIVDATPEQIAAIQKAEQEFQLQMKQLDIQSVEELEKMAGDDRANARQMQVETKSKVPAVLALLVTLGFFGMLAGMMFGALKPTENQPMLLMLGSLSTSWGAVINYYFGSSAGSDRKTELMANGSGH